MFCEQCGNQLSENVKFCPKCGNEMGAKTDAVQQIPDAPPDVQKSSENASPVKEVSAGKRGGRVLSVIFSVLIVLIGILCSIILLVRHVTSEDVIDGVVKQVDLSKMEVGFLTEDDEDMTLSEYISDYAGALFSIPWSEADVEEILDEKFIRNFAADKVNDYVRDLFRGTGEGVIEAKELERLLKKNEDAIYKITGVHLLDSDFEDMAEMMEREDILENTALSVYRNDDPGMFSLIKNLFSYWMLALLLFLALLLVFGIFFVQGRKWKGFCYLGISMAFIGAVNLVTSVFIVNSLAEKMNSSLELGRKFWRLLFAPAQKMSVSLGIFWAAAGAISGLIYIIALLCGKHAGKPEKMRAPGK